MMRKLVCVLLFLAAAVPASATVRISTGFEGGKYPKTSGGTEFFFSEASTTRPTYVATTSGQRCNAMSANYGKVCTADSDCDDTSKNVYAKCQNDNGSTCSGGTCSLNMGSCSTNADCSGNDYELRFNIPDTATANWVKINAGDSSVGPLKNLYPISAAYIHFTLEAIDIPTENCTSVFCGQIGSTYEIAAVQSQTALLGILRLKALYDGVEKQAYYDLEFSPAGNNTYAANECIGGTSVGVTCTPCDDDSDCTAGTCYNAGTTGACDDVCLATTPGEQWCVPRIIATAPRLYPNRRYEIMFSVDQAATADPKDASYSLYLGGYELGSQDKDLGACDNHDCDNDADCTGSCTVPVTGMDSPIYTIRFGQTANASYGGWDLRVDDVVMDDASTLGDKLSTLRIHDTVPNAYISAGGCTGTAVGCTQGSTDHQCVDDDLPGPDDATSYLTCPGDGTDYTIFGIGDIHQCSVSADCGSNGTCSSNVCTAGSPLNGDVADAADTVMAVSSILRGVDIGTGGTYQLCESMFLDGASANESTATVSNDLAPDKDSWDSCGYSVADSSVWDRIGSGGGANYGFNNARLKMQIRKSAATGGNTQVTAAVIEAAVQRRRPALPGIASDVNEDGQKRFCLFGDSTVDVIMRSLLLADLKDFDGFTACTRGGTTLGDIENALTNMLDGVPGGYMTCKSFKGTPGPCDYAVIVSGANTMAHGVQPNSYCRTGTNIGKKCTSNSDCAGPGICDYYANGYCRGGTQHGMPCFCPRTHFSSSGEGHCINRKTEAFWLSTAYPATCNDCSSNNDCDTGKPCTTSGDCGGLACVNNATVGYSTCRAQCGYCMGGTGASYGAYCTSDATCTAIDATSWCVEATCFNNIGTAAWQDASYTYPPLGSWTMPGCPDTEQCPQGLCTGTNTVAEAISTYDRILQKAAARKGRGASCTNCRVEMILAMQPRGQDLSDSWWTFVAGAPYLDQVQQHMRGHAVRNNLGFIDIDRAFMRATQGPKAQHNDSIHWSYAGYTNARRLFLDCFENREGTSDGYCVGGNKGDGLRDGVCSVRPDGAEGALGEACDTDADCAMYRCDLLVPDWKGATAAVFGADGVCVGGSDPLDDCSSNDDCSGGECHTVAATDAELRDRSGNGGLLTTSTVDTAASGLFLGTNEFLFDVLSDNLQCSPSSATGCPSLNISGSQYEGVAYGGWFKFDSVGTSGSKPAIMITKWASNNGYQLHLDGSRHPVCRINGTAVTGDTIFSIPMSNYAHIFCNYDVASGRIDVYVNGALDNATGAFLPAGTTIGSNGNNFQIGTVSTSTGFTGRVDEVTVFDKPISGSHVTRITSGSITGDFVDCDGFVASKYQQCTHNNDCGDGEVLCDSNDDCGYGVCDDIGETDGVCSDVTPPLTCTCDKQVCDTANSATNDPNCDAPDDGDGGAGCCMGFNSSRAAGVTLTPCNATP